MEKAHIAEVTCRQKQCQQLHELLAQDVPPQAVFVYGQNATGKTLVVKNVLEEAKVSCKDLLCEFIYTTWSSFSVEHCDVW